MARLVISIYDDPGNPHYGGGGAGMATRLAALLADDGHHVEMVCGSYPGSGRSQMRGPVKVSYLPVGWLGARGGQLAFQLALPLVAAVKRHDAWVESFTPPFSVSLVNLTTRAPVIGWAQMLSGALMRRTYHLPFDRFEALGLRHYRSLIAINEPDAARMRECAPQAQVHLLPNGIPIGPEPGPRKRTAKPYLLFLGRIDTVQKGLDLLMAARARSVQDLELVIAGSGTRSELAQLDRLCAGLPGVRRVGRVEGEAKAELLRECEFLVMSSRAESFGLVSLEALAAGRPVIAFDIPQLGWLHSPATRLVPAFDVDALAAAIDTWSTDPLSLEEAASHAREHARRFDERKTLRDIADQVLALLPT